MRVAAGKVVVEGAPLAEGAAVVVLVLDDDETFELSPTQEDELLVALAQAGGGEGDGWRRLVTCLQRTADQRISCLQKF